MKPFATLLKELVGLFFDDGRLALTVLAILGATALLQLVGPFGAPASAAFLVAGVIAALLENVIRSARAIRRET